MTQDHLDSIAGSRKEVVEHLKQMDFCLKSLRQSIADVVGVIKFSSPRHHLQDICIESSSMLYLREICSQELDGTYRLLGTVMSQLQGMHWRIITFKPKKGVSLQKIYAGSFRSVSRNDLILTHPQIVQQFIGNSMSTEQILQNLPYIAKPTLTVLRRARPLTSQQILAKTANDFQELSKAYERLQECIAREQIP